MPATPGGTDAAGGRDAPTGSPPAARRVVFPVHPGAAPRRPAAGYGLALGAALCFAVSASVAATLLRSGVGPADLAQFRILGSVGILLAVGMVRPARLRLHRGQVPAVVAFGLLALFGTQYTFYGAIERIPVAVTSLLQATGPVLVLVITVLVLRSAPAPIVWIVVGITLLGCWLATGAYRFSFGPDDAAGVGWALASAACFAAYFLAGERLVARLSPLTTLTWGYVVAGLAWAVVDIVRGRVPDLPTDRLGGVAVVVLLGTLIPTMLNTMALRLLGGAATAVSTAATPPLSGLVAWWALGERLAPPQVAGGAAALGALAFLQVHDVRSARPLRAQRKTA